MTTVDVVSPTFFDTMRMPILEGRGLTAFDRDGSARIAVVSQAMARHFWPGEDAIGKRFRLAIEKDYIQVVGVSANSVVAAMGEQPQPVVYFPIDQRYQSAVALVVPTAGNPTGVMAEALQQVQSFNRDTAQVNPRTIQEDIAAGLWAPRMRAALFGTFGLLALVLASVGFYGVMTGQRGTAHQ